MTSLGITQDVGNLDLESLIVITTMFFRIIGVSLDNSNRSPVERLSISHSAIRNPHSAINVPIASAATGCVQARSSFHAVPVYRDDILVRSRSRFLPKVGGCSLNCRARATVRLPRRWAISLIDWSNAKSTRLLSMFLRKAPSILTTSTGEFRI